MTDETSKHRSWWEILAALTPLILGITITGVGAFFTQVYNFRQLQLNQINALDKFRTQLASDDPFEREFAYASFVALGYEELAVKLITLKQDSAGRAVIQEIAASGPIATKNEAAAALAALPVQVYLHIADESQREHARAIETALEAKGYVAPGIENVAGKAEIPNKTNVRYFNEQDRATADAIVMLLHQLGVNAAYAYQVPRLKVKPGSLEIWFGPRDL